MRSTVFALALPLVAALPQGQHTQAQNLADAFPGKVFTGDQNSIQDDDKPPSPPQNNSDLVARGNVFMFPNKDPQDPAQGLNFPKTSNYDQFKTFSLNLHNQVRPSYGIGNSLGWDDEFAYEAYLWANTCVYKHGTTRQLSRGWGQNIAWDTRLDGPLQMMARSFYLWFYSESRYYDFQSHDMMPQDQANQLWQQAGGISGYSPQVHHFENILKKEFGGLGCSINYCPVLQDEIAGQTHYNVYYSVCDFSQNPGSSSDSDFPSFPTTDVPQLKDAMNF